MRALVRSFAFVAVVAACSSSTDDAQVVPVAELPALGNASTTLERTLVPRHAVSKPAEARKPADPEGRASLLADGFGEVDVAPGEPTVAQAFPGTTAPPAGPGKKRLTRFVHLADLQLADDESPTRLARADTPGVTGASFRPQDAFVCRMTNAVVRTVNALHKKDPISFLVLGGDNADSAQDNELEWVLSILGGADRVKCDSGNDDDPVKGPNNDGKDPFRAEGLAMPFYWVNGNHDVMVQGNFVVDAARNEAAIGASAAGGTRDWREPGGPVLSGDVPADPRRKLLSPAQVLGKVQAHQGGHGLSPAVAATGKATFTFDVQGTPLRFLVIDTTSATGGSEGILRKSDRDLLKPLLDASMAEGKLVVLSSHHAVSSLGDGQGLGGAAQPDALTRDEYMDFIGGYPNVLFSMVGHSHEHRVRPITPSKGHGWWEVMTSAIADFPHEFRVVEIWDDDNGYLRLVSTAVDFATDDDPVALEGKKLGVLDFTSGWAPEGRGEAKDRNVELVIKKP